MLELGIAVETDLVGTTYEAVKLPTVATTTTTTTTTTTAPQFVLVYQPNPLNPKEFVNARTAGKKFREYVG